MKTNETTMSTENRTSHTPGPWTHTAAGLIQAPSQPRALAYVYVADYDACRGDSADRAARETEANARLIAAAPELLDQLVKMTDAYAKAMKDAGVSHYPEALFVVRQARSAIARARSQSTGQTL